jgi:hypothetical protein
VSSKDYLDIKEHDLAKVFRVLTQNDPSYFTKVVSAKDKVSLEKKREQN